MAPRRGLRGLRGQGSAGSSDGRLLVALRATLVCAAWVALGGCSAEKPEPMLPKPAVSQPAPPPAALPAPAVPKAEPNPDAAALYFPHNPGDSWQMVMKGEETTDKLNLSIATGGPGSDSRRFYLTTRRGTEVVQRDGYVADEKGLNFVSSGVPDLSRIDPPMPILRIPVTSGDGWDWKGKFRSAAGDLEADAHFTVAGPDRVEAPGGIFDAFRIEQRVVVHAKPDVLTTTTMWLAPNVGLVKQVVETPDHKGEALLSAYKVVKK